MREGLTQPKIAIVIAAYNAEHYIERCLDSIKSQDYENWVAYIINDGSTDLTENICRNYSEKDARYVLLNKENGGVVEARRYGIEHVQNSDYLTFLDSDDTYLTADLFTNIAREIVEFGADCVCFNYQVGEKNLFSNCKEPYVFENEKDIVKNIYRRTIIDGNLQFAVYPTDIVKKYFQVLECANDDYINKLNMILHCRRVVYIPDVGYYYMVNQSSLTHTLPKESDIVYYEHAKVHTKEYVDKYPEIEQEAEYFKNWILLWLATSLSKDIRAKKVSYYNQIMRDVRQAGNCFMKNRFFSRKERLSYMLIRLHLFRIFYQVYHMVLKGYQRG